MTKSKLLRMDNVGIVVESLDDAISFFTELGLTLKGRVEIAMMVTPYGHGRLELSRFLTPSVAPDHRNAPVNALGYLCAMFTMMTTSRPKPLTRLRKRGAQLPGWLAGCLVRRRPSAPGMKSLARGAAPRF